MIKPMNRNQQGFVAIFSVLIIMGILTLLAIGFSSITRQAQRRTLDDQLNTQAFYAAESGINQVIARLDSVTQKESCVDVGDGYEYEIGDPALGVTISCLLVDTSPPTLEFSTVPLIGSEPIVAYMSSDAGSISQLRFSWDSTDPAAPVSRNSTAPIFDSGGNPQLWSASAWGNGIGMVRVDLVPANDLARSNVAGNGYTFFLYPGGHTADADPGSGFGSGTTTDVSSGLGGKGIVVGRECSRPASEGYRCAANVRLTPAGASFYVRLQSYYSATKVRVEGQASGGGAVNFVGGQALIDSTGRVADVSRRIQARIPLFQSVGYHEPFSILSANSICKRLVVAGTSSASIGDVTDANDKALCNPVNN